jgi:hypothetical protein
MAGLDPAISSRERQTRVKPAHDGEKKITR